MAKVKNWHSLTNAELEREFRSDTATGLDNREAARRLRHARNSIWEVRTASVRKYAAASMLDFTTVLLVVTVAAEAFFGNGNEALAVCALLVLCRALRIGLYVYAKRTLEKNASFAIPRARVVRGGNVISIPAEEIVVGDVVVLDIGDTVPCDIRLTAADNVVVAEGSITDKNGIRRKNAETINTGANADVPISMRTNMLYATSVMVDGFAIGMAVATGKDTLIYSREGKNVIPGGEGIPVMDKLTDWSRVCSLFLVASALVVTVLGITVGSGSLFGIFLPAVSMAAASLSEFIGAVGLFSVAVSLKRKKDAPHVFKNPSALNAAADSDVILIRSAETMKSGRITLHSYYTDSKLKLMGTKNAGVPTNLLTMALYCTGMTPNGSIASGAFGRKVRQKSFLGYETLRELWKENSEKEGLPQYTVAGHLTAGEENSDGFDSSLLMAGDKFYFAMTGNAKRVLTRCTKISEDGKVLPLTEEKKKNILSYIEELQKRGAQVCGVGMRESPYNSLRRASVLQSNLTFEGFFAVSDRMETGCREFVEEFRKEGGRIVFFSENGTEGNDEDKYFLSSEGVFRTGDLYLDGVNNKLPLEKGSLSVVRIPSGADGIKARLKIIEDCRREGLVASYIGYGVEDMWCAGKADVSFGVNAPAAVTVPQSLRGVCHGIYEGEGGGFYGCASMIKKCRTSLCNIKNILSYLLMSHVTRLILMTVCAVMSLPGINALQTVFWGAVLDFIVTAAISSVPESGGYCKKSECALPETGLSVLYPILYGMLTALTSCVTPLIAGKVISLTGVEYALSESSAVLCMFLSSLVAMPFIGAEFAGRKGIFSKESVYGKMFAVPFAATTAGVILFLLSPISKIPFPGFSALPFLILPAVITVSAMSVVRAVKNKSDKKEKGDI